MRTQGGSVLYVCTKLDADSSIRSKVIREVPKFRNWVQWPRPRPLRGRLWSSRRSGPSSISVSNLKRIAQFIQKLLRGGHKIWKLGHMTQPRPLTGRFIICTQGGSILYVCTKCETDSSIRSKVISGPKILKLGHVT